MHIKKQSSRESQKQMHSYKNTQIPESTHKHKQTYTLSPTQIWTHAQKQAKYTHQNTQMHIDTYSYTEIQTHTNYHKHIEKV